MTLALALGAARSAHAQSATVTLTSQKQYIRGFGGMIHVSWMGGDMTAAERTLAFGNASGQLGLSILRLPVSDGNPDSTNVATAKAAVAAGAILLGTPWNSNKGTYTSAQFDSYLTHLNDFVAYMKNQGAELYAISVQNEPDYGAQSGWGVWSPAACHDFVLNYGSKVTTRLMSCESFNYSKSYYDPILNDPAALANMDILGTHLYGTAVNAYAYSLFDQKGAGKERWMTEHYTDSTTDANSWPNALGVASEIHNAMVTGQFNAYIWWYIKRSYGFINNGAVTKRGYCIGHWSKFIRPGFYRVDATASPTSGVSLSAYQGDSSVVIVMVNTNSGEKTLSVSVPGSSIASFTKYTTSSSKSLASDGTVTATNGSLSVSLDGSSVTTLVGTGPGGGGTPGTGGAPGAGGTNAGGASPGGGTSAGGGRTSGGAGGISAGGRGNAGSPGAGGATLPGGGATANGGALANQGGALAAGGSTFGGAMTGAGGAATNAGGRTAAGGALASNGGATSTAGNSGSSDDSGCSCRVAGQGESQPSRAAALLGVLGALALGARRRRPKG